MTVDVTADMAILMKWQELFEELKIYMVTFDRLGYGESDLDPKKQTVKSLALDMEDLADKLEFGSKFYVIGYSMGQQGAWGSLKYITQVIGMFL
ncbi:putative alpha/Beta hydrolase [Helianthus annuus]|nr:putative alpha/Beta hydrolase [Helianthus annuus]KAJ0725476.1 putative alpha/Beta hydrolase [Helianthus annuus]